MKRWIAMLAGLAAAWLLLPSSSPSRGDYLGKSAAQWQQELTLAKDAKTKRSAAFALGKCGIQALQAVPALMKCLQSDSEDPGVRETAAYALGQIVPRSSASQELVQLLCRLAATKADDDRLPRSAIVALGTCGTDTADIRAALEKALEDASPAVRQNAAWALGEICQHSEDPPLWSLRLAFANKEKDKLVKRDAALALGKVVAQLPPAGGDAAQRVGKVREQARAAIPDLLGCVGQDYVELKKAAAGTLINLVNSQDVQALPILAKACAKNEDIEVRFNAAQALAAIGGAGSEAAVPVLLDVLRTKKDDPERNLKGDAEWRRTAILAFRNLGSVAAAALPDLLQILATDPDLQVRYNTAVALGGWKTNNHLVVPALVQRVVDSDENIAVRVAASMSLQSIGQCKEAIAAMPLLVKVLADPQQPAQIRERVLFAMRVHQNDLDNYQDVFAALKEILVEPGLRDPASGGKMLRYDAAYLFGIYKQAKAPKEVFPVLTDFLKDNGIRIFAGLATGGGRVAEGGSSKSVVAEQGVGDGRINAVEALQRIGAKRVKTQPEIIQELKSLRDSDQAVEPKLREASAKLLKDCGVK